MKLSEFDYTLPEGLIAQYPLKERDRCGLMVMDRKRRSIEHRAFGDIAEYFREGDCLVLNNTRVIPARLFARRKTGGKIEILLLEKKGPVAEALLRPSGRVKEGEVVVLESGDEAVILGRGDVGRFVRFSAAIDDILRKAGHIPLPPYIARSDEPDDRSDYQTVYGTSEGATASPTAGLHFTEEVIEKIRARGVEIAYVTLHTNYGTFQPVKSDEVESHRMHKEYYELPQAAADAVKRAKLRGNSVFAVGTTANRVLEHCADNMQVSSGWTSLYIYPGYKFRVVDHLITNFHMPRSTLFILVSAFAGKEFIMDAYRQAIERRYRFFSYGDATLVL